MSSAVLQAPASAKAPRAYRERFREALNRADATTATACFARRGCLITPDGTAVHGREAIRPLLAQLADRHTAIQVGASDLLCSGESALLREQWHIRSAGVGGEPFAQETIAIVVLSAIEGDWKLSILAPWGWGAGSPTEAPFVGLSDQGGRQ